MAPTPLALIQAAHRGDEAIVRELLGAGADPDAGQGPPVDTARRRRTALMAACEGSHPGCVKALLEAKASLRFVDADGRDALAWALEGGRPRSGPEFAREAKDSPSALACVELLLDAGAAKNINKLVGKGHDKATPLGRATSWLDLGCMSLLLKRGADPCQETMVHVRWHTNAALCIGRQWNTPLASAVSRNGIDACQLLFDAGADPTAKPQWQPGIELIAQRCARIDDETKAFLAGALDIHRAREEAKALDAAAGAATAPSARPRM